ncbi:putative cytochrome P450 12b2, mitochondrial, partial [Zootermopsis nevadensis]
TNVAIPNCHLCRQEKYFAQPDKYIPERWLKVTDRDMQKTKTTHPFVFMPFGFGPRTCVGRRLAELELETLLTKVRSTRPKVIGTLIRNQTTVVNAFPRSPMLQRMKRASHADCQT